MSDLIVMREMLERSGIPFTESTFNNEIILAVDADSGEPARGYGGFVSQFYFSFPGSLIAVGAWE